MDCRFYCMIQAAFSVVFLLYLFLLVAFGSETLYIPVHHRVASALSLLFSAIIYGAIFWWLYYKIYINIDRKQDLRRWLEERRAQRKNIHEMREMSRQSQLLSERRSSLKDGSFN